MNNSVVGKIRGGFLGGAMDIVKYYRATGELEDNEVNGCMIDDTKNMSNFDEIDLSYRLMADKIRNNQ